MSAEELIHVAKDGQHEQKEQKITEYGMSPQPLKGILRDFGKTEINVTRRHL
jgi:hypothetical protein